MIELKFLINRDETLVAPIRRERQLIQPTKIMSSSSAVDILTWMRQKIQCTGLK